MNVTTDDSGDAGDSTITGWYKDEETGDWYYYDKNGKLVTGWFKDGGNEVLCLMKTASLSEVGSMTVEMMGVILVMTENCTQIGSK